MAAGGPSRSTPSRVAMSAKIVCNERAATQLLTPDVWLGPTGAHSLLTRPGTHLELSSIHLASPAVDGCHRYFLLVTQRRGILSGPAGSTLPLTYGEPPIQWPTR